MGFIVTFIVCQSSANWWGYSVSHQVIKDLVSYVFQDFLLFSSQVVDEWMNERCMSLSHIPEVRTQFHQTAGESRNSNLVVEEKTDIYSPCHVCPSGH
jgi:hypothetical protein